MKIPSFSVYSKEQLPINFTYPDSFLELSENTSVLGSVSNFSWWFEDAQSETGRLAYTLRNEHSNGLNLIPFARLFDWAAYFDGDDTSGDPKVYVLDLGDLPHCVELKNFDEWLDKAKNHCF